MAKKEEKGDALEQSVESTKRKTEAISVRAPNMQVLELCIVGDAPYVQHKFSAKALEQMMATQAAGGTARSKRKRDPKDFDQVCKDATHWSRQGWVGIPASAFRNAMISACRLVGFKMTLAKLAVFIKADGYDKHDGTPLVRIYGQSRRHDRAARNDNGSVDIRSRPMWESGMAKVCVRFDGDTFTATDISNLMMRVGLQVGIGEGRADSKNSAGIGWGSYELSDRASFDRFVGKEKAA
jgi:hypothetical protein